MSYRALVTSPLRGPVRGSSVLGDGTGEGSARSPTAHVSSSFIFPSTAAAGKQQTVSEPTVTVQQTWVHLRRDATQSIATGAGDGVNWDTQVAFPQAEGEALYASLPTDTLTAPFDGMLFYAFGSRWDAGATPGTNVRPELNGTTFDTSRTYLTPTAAVETWQPETEFFPVSEGDTVRWVISHDQGSAQTLLRADMWVLLIADNASVVPMPVDTTPEVTGCAFAGTSPPFGFTTHNFTVTHPAETADGDLVVLVLNLAAGVGVNPPAGWTATVDDVNNISVYMKTVTGAEVTSSAWQATDEGSVGTVSVSWNVFSIPGGSASSNVFATDTGASMPDNLTHICPSVTAPDDALLLCVWMCNGATGGTGTDLGSGFTVPASMTEECPVQRHNGTGNWASETGSASEAVAAAATGTRTATASSNGGDKADNKYLSLIIESP